MKITKCGQLKKWSAVLMVTFLVFQASDANAVAIWAATKIPGARHIPAVNLFASVTDVVTGNGKAGCVLFTSAPIYPYVIDYLKNKKRSGSLTDISHCEEFVKNNGKRLEDVLGSPIPVSAHYAKCACADVF